MKLSLKERFKIMASLPEKGTFEKQIIKKDLLEKISITQKDVEKYSISEIGDKLSWKFVDDSDSEEFTFSELEVHFLKSLLKKQDEDGELHDDLIVLYKTLFDK